MRSIIALFKALLLMSMMLGCQTKLNHDAEVAKLLSTDREYAQISIDHGTAQAFPMYMTADTLSLPNGSDPVRGVENICAGMDEFDKEYVLLWEAQEAEVSQTADMGYTWGVYKEVKKGEEDKRPLNYGKYLTVWKKQNDGKWKVIRDMGNKSPLPEEAL